MIWRGDEGTIWAFYGATGGLMGGYPVAVYAGLPVTVESAPAGKVKPIMGFGKVWSNFPDVRNGLGWAVAGEQSYTMTYQNAKDWPGFTVTMPAGRTIYATRNTLWNLGVDGGTQNTPPPPNPQVISTQAAFEPFENGFTVWRQDTGAVEVFYNANSRFMSYAESTYKSLPDNPVTDSPPQG
jgi:hypothetical protein